MKKTIVRATIVAVALLSSSASTLFAVSGNMSDVSASAPLGAISSTIGSAVGGSVAVGLGATPGVVGGGNQGQGQGQDGQNDQQRPIEP